MATEIWSVDEAARIADSQLGRDSFLLVRRIDRLRDADLMREILHLQHPRPPVGSFRSAVLNSDEVLMAARLDRRLEQLERAVKDVVSLYGDVETLEEAGAKVATAAASAFRQQFEDQSLPEVVNLSLSADRAATLISLSAGSIKKLLQDIPRVRDEEVLFDPME